MNQNAKKSSSALSPRKTVFFAHIRVAARLVAVAGIGLGIGVGTLSSFTACQVYNSSSQDPQRYVSGSVEDQARSVLATRCSSCHSFSTMPTATLISSGRIVAKNPASSTLLTRIRGSDLGGAENMPPNDTISTDEIAVITKWISSL